MSAIETLMAAKAAMLQTQATAEASALADANLSAKARATDAGMAIEDQHWADDDAFKAAQSAFNAAHRAVWSDPSLKAEWLALKA